MKLRHLFFLQTVFILSFIFCLKSFSETSISSVSNASAFLGSTIYGGIAGNVNGGECSNKKKSTTCSNCENSLKACNEKRIFPNLKLRIFFSYDASLSGTPILVDSSDDTKLNINGTESSIQDGQGVIVVSWSVICENSGSSSNCSSSSSANYEIGIETDSDFAEPPVKIKIVILRPGSGDHDTVNDCNSSPIPTNGICQFELFPGDEKVYFSDADHEGLDISGGFNYPNLEAGEKVSAIRVFFVSSAPSGSGAGFQELKKVSELLKNESYSDLPVTSEGNLNNSQVSGLINQESYFVRLALLDNSGNMSFFTSDSQLQARDCDISAGANTNSSMGCKAIATTDEVFGLLSKDLNCFIATASYGTNFNKKLDTFRKFRSEILLKYPWGRKFNSWYYKYGSMASPYIYNKPILKSVIRTFLWPLWWAAKLALHFTEVAEAQNSYETEDTYNSEKPKFDPKEIRRWDKRKKTRRIYHPNAKKGLIKITRDLEYLYKVKTSPQKDSVSFKIGEIEFTSLKNPETENFFKDFYRPKNFMFLLDYQWQKKFLGRFAIKTGTGLFFSNGVGQFKSERNSELVPFEKFTFIMLPNSLSAVYKLQFSDRQWIVPYFDSGVDLFTFMEFRDDKLKPRLGASAGYHVAGGIDINLSGLDYWSTINLDREYGINAVYFTIEMKQYFHIKSNYNFQGQFISAGFSFDI